MDLAKIWLLKMDSRGEYEKSSILIFRKILGDQYDNFKEYFMDASERFLKELEETWEAISYRHFL